MNLMVMSSKVFSNWVLPVASLFLFAFIIIESSQSEVSIERRNPAYEYMQSYEVNGIPHYSLISSDYYPNGYCPDDVADWLVVWEARRTAQLEGSIAFLIERDNEILFTQVIQYFPFIHIDANQRGAAQYNYVLPDIERSIPSDANAYIRGAFWNGAGGVSVYRVRIPLNTDCWQ